MTALSVMTVTALSLTRRWMTALSVMTAHSVMAALSVMGGRVLDINARVRHQLDSHLLSESPEA
jgi:hypothetical protein